MVLGIRSMKSTQSRWRWAGAGLLLATVFCVPGDAQQASPAQAQNPQSPPPGGQAPQPPPIFQTGINVVRVDVIVTDSKTGQPVADLKQTEFQVTEDNQRPTV